MRLLSQRQLCLCIGQRTRQFAQRHQAMDALVQQGVPFGRRQAGRGQRGGGGLHGVGMAAGTPIIIVAKKGLQPKDLAEFVTFAKAQGDKLNQAHAGLGSVSHITCVLLNSQLGVKPTSVAYRGTGPALNDLVSGQVDFMCDQIVNLVEQIKSGSIKAYAVATPVRSPALPDLPTAKEAGLPGYEVSAWNAIFAPKGTPDAITAKLNDALSKALDDDNTKKRLLDLGAVLPDQAGRTREWLKTFVAAEVARWTPVLKAAGVTAN
jgi:tripartite-type tricarboxylate transporter receptor subunit TctC